MCSALFLAFHNKKAYPSSQNNLDCVNKTKEFKYLISQILSLEHIFNIFCNKPYANALIKETSAENYTQYNVIKNF